jgi:hypothetical protein
MANVGLDGTNPEWISGCPPLSQDVVDSSGFNRVAYSRACAVSLDEAAFGRVKSSIAVDLVHEDLYM